MNWGGVAVGVEASVGGAEVPDGVVLEAGADDGELDCDWVEEPPEELLGGLLEVDDAGWRNKIRI